MRASGGWWTFLSKDWNTQEAVNKKAAHEYETAGERFSPAHQPVDANYSG
jgi:hypothetical protein